MGRKLEFRRELTNINIRREDAHELAMMKRYHEPLYSVFHRIMCSRNTEILDLMALNEQQREQLQAWMKRALEAENKLKSVQKTLF